MLCYRTIPSFFGYFPRRLSPFLSHSDIPVSGGILSVFYLHYPESLRNYGARLKLGAQVRRVLYHETFSKRF